MQDWISQREIATIVVSIIIGILIRVIYDFIVKPILQKKEQDVSAKRLKYLIKKAADSYEDFVLLLNCLSSCENNLLKSYYLKLKAFDTKQLSEEEHKNLQKILKDLKKVSK